MNEPKKIVAGPAPKPAGGQENTAGAKNRILVVDDDPAIREMLTRVLVGEGYLVWAASNGTAALELARAANVDLVLLDLNMPGKSGWDVFEKLTTENPWLIVIIITARPNQLFTALGSGVGALLEKPLDFPQLLQTIHYLMNESTHSRLERMAGKSAVFHYIHAPHPDERNQCPESPMPPRKRPT
jgi:DNA-binding response OmpR family regulator